MIARQDELDAHDARLEARHQQEDEAGGDVHEAEALVIDGDHPLVHEAEHRRAPRDSRPDGDGGIEDGHRAQRSVTR